MNIGLFIIAIFIAIPLAVGFYAATKAQATSDDLFIQGRQMGSVAAFFTVAATWWSAFAFLGSNASFYAEGPVYLTAFAWNILFGFMYYLIGKPIWHLGKKFNYVTPSDLLGDFYNSERMRFIVGIVVIIFTLPHLQIQLTGGAYLIEVTSGNLIPFWLAALIFYAVIVTYVWVGGIRAVAWTDIIYGVLILFGLVAGGVYLSTVVVGGPTDMFAQMQQSLPEHLTLPGPQGDAGYARWISLCVITAIGALMGPQMWLRMYAVKNGRLFDLMPFLIALIAIAYVGSILTAWTGALVMPGVDNADQILPLMLVEYAPVMMAGVILAGGAGAAMSTANSQIHAASTVVTKDFYHRYARPDAPDHRLRQVGRYALVIYSILAYLLTLVSPGLLITVGLIAFGGSAQLIVPTCGALFWKRANGPGAITGLVAGLLVTVGLQFIPVIESPLGLDPAMWGLAVNTILFVSVSLLTAPRDPEVVDRFQSALREFERVH